MRTRFIEVTADLLDTDESIAVVLADIGVSRLAQTGAADRHPSRVINVGLREQLLIGVAAGLALEGMQPIVHSYTPFLIERPFEQIKLDLGHQDVGAVLVSIGASFDAAGEGRTHQSPGDVALMSTLPDWSIHIPGHPDELEVILRSTAADGGRSYIRLSETSNLQSATDGPGGLSVLRRGSGPTVVAVGPMLNATLAAVDGLDATVVYVTTVRPLDGAGLRAVAGSEVVLVEPYLEGTSAGALGAALLDRPHRVLSIGVPNIEHRHYGTAADHAAALGLDSAGIRRRVDNFLA